MASQVFSYSFHLNISSLRKKDVGFCLSCLCYCWRCPSLVFIIDILTEGRKLFSENFYWPVVSYLF